MDIGSGLRRDARWRGDRAQPNLTNPDRCPEADLIVGISGCIAGRASIPNILPATSLRPIRARSRAWTPGCIRDEATVEKVGGLGEKQSPMRKENWIPLKPGPFFFCAWRLSRIAFHSPLQPWIHLCSA